MTYLGIMSTPTAQTVVSEYHFPLKVIKVFVKWLISGLEQEMFNMRLGSKEDIKDC